MKPGEIIARRRVKPFSRKSEPYVPTGVVDPNQSASVLALLKHADEDLKKTFCAEQIRRIDREGTRKRLHQEIEEAYLLAAYLSSLSSD